MIRVVSILFKCEATYAMADAEAYAVMYAKAYAVGGSPHTRSAHACIRCVCVFVCVVVVVVGGGHNMHECLLFKMRKRRRRCACGRVCEGGGKVHALGGRGGS